MKRRRIHVLYEHGNDPRPYSSSYIRLLRPLTHPHLRDLFEVTWDVDYDRQMVDAVVVDRLWRPDVSVGLAEALLTKARRAGARLIYSIDDDLPGILAQGDGQARFGLRPVAELFLRQAGGVLVSTDSLRERLACYNPRIEVVPNALDERLLLQRSPTVDRSAFGPRRKVIGYMGTLTHDDDLLMILPALETVCRRRAGAVQIQLVGGIAREETRRALSGLPLRVLPLHRWETEYPLFMLWFGGRVRWDIALAPLRESLLGSGKSDVKFLDYSAIGAAGIYSRMPAYEASVRHLETGWLAENETGAWVEALETLLDDGQLRRRLAENAAGHLYGERCLAQRAPAWAAALERLLDGAG